MNFIYKPKGVCARLITLQIEDGIIEKVTFTDGCNGNLQGISALVQGMSATQAVEKLKGIRCGVKKTSCPDQLAEAIASALEEDSKSLKEA